VPPVQQWAIDSHNTPMVPQSGHPTTHYDSNANTYRFPLIPPASVPHIPPHPLGVGPEISVSETAFRGTPFSANLLSNAYQARPTSVSPVVNRPSPPNMVGKPDGDGGSN